MKNKTSEKEMEEARANLKRLFPAGSTVYTILRNVSSGGMSRDISVVSIGNGTVIHPSYAVHKVLGYRLISKCGNDALTVTGCGFDAGFDIVYGLSLALYGEEKALHHEWL